MRTGHLVERAEITIAISLLFDDTTRWFKHAEIVEHCREMMGYKPHDDCVRLVLRRMVKDVKAEISVKAGNFYYRCPTALHDTKMVGIRARHAKRKV